MRVWVVGAGKVGSALVAAFRRAGHEAKLTSARAVLARRPRPARADVWVVASRDRSVNEVAGALVAELSRRPKIERPGAVVHVAGALSIDALAVFRSVNIPIGKMHPLLSFAARTAPPELGRATLFLEGDAGALRLGRRMARALGMVPRTAPDLSPSAYHLAAALVANGAVTLVGQAAAILEKGGVPSSTATAMLGPLLRSVASNVEALGLPGALTGPVRRGDVATTEAHLAWLERARDSAGRDLLLALLPQQIELSRAIGEADPGALAALARLVAAAPPKPKTRARRKPAR